MCFYVQLTGLGGNGLPGFCLEIVCALSGTIVRCKPWHCATCAVIKLQAKKRNLPPLCFHAPLEVYPDSFRELRTRVEPYVFILSRSTGTHSKLGGMLPYPLTLQCTCHLFSMWSGQLLGHLEDQKQDLLVCDVKEKKNSPTSE